MAPLTGTSRLYSSVRERGELWDSLEEKKTERGRKISVLRAIYRSRLTCTRTQDSKYVLHMFEPGAQQCSSVHGGALSCATNQEALAKRYF